MEHFRELLNILKTQDFKSLIAHENELCKSVAASYSREVKISIDKCFAIYQKKFTFSNGTPLHLAKHGEPSSESSEEDDESGNTTVADFGFPKTNISAMNSPPLTVRSSK